MLRHYRSGMNSERFRFFPSVCQESDLLIGVPHDAFTMEMPGLCFRIQKELYTGIWEHADRYPDFLKSLEPLADPANLSEEAIDQALFSLYDCGRKSGTGPMAGVAGLFARELADGLEKAFEPEEIIIENGGDLYVKNREELLSVIHAGESPLSDKLGLMIPPGTRGICTSSGTLGHSFSRGRADALTVVAQDAVLADSWATSLANRVKDAGDIPEVLERAGEVEEIQACVIIFGDRIGVRGEFELKPIS